MKKKYKLILIIASIMLISIILINSGTNLFSIVSQSNVNYETTTNTWTVTSIAVDNDERIDFTTPQMVDTTFDSSSNIQSAKATLAFTLFTKAKDPFCSYNLTWDSLQVNLIGFPLTSMPYARLGTGSSLVLQVPYDITIARQDGIEETKSLDASTLGANSVWMLNNNVEIRSLGQLSQGIACPSESMALIPIINNGSITGWRLVSQSSLDGWKSNVNNYINQCFFNFWSCPSQFASYISNPSISSPNATFVSSNIDTISQGATKFVGNLPKGSSIAYITVGASKNFVGTTIVYKPNGTPQVELSFDKSSITQGGIPAIMTVKTTNVGTSADSFRIIPSTNAIVNFNPISQDTASVAVNSSTLKTFTVYGFGSGSANVNVTVCGIGSGRCVSAVKTLAVALSPQLPVEPQPQPVEVCGNGICNSSAGENYYSCAKDCGVAPVSCVCGDGVCCGSEFITCGSDCSSPTPSPAPRESCIMRQTDIWVVGWNWNEGVLGIGANCSPIYNFTLIGLVFIGSVVFAVVLIFVLPRVMRRRRG